MKTWIWVVVALIVVGAGAALYFYPGLLSSVAPSLGGTESNIDTATGEPPTISSTAGAVAEGTGTLSGRARAPSGVTVDFAKVVIGVYDPATGEELQRTALGADGSYKFSVTAGEYQFQMIDGESIHLPQQVYVGEGETIELNFQVSN